MDCAGGYKLGDQNQIRGDLCWCLSVKSLLSKGITISAAKMIWQSGAAMHTSYHRLRLGTSMAAHERSIHFPIPLELGIIFDSVVE